MKKNITSEIGYYNNIEIRVHTKSGPLGGKSVLCRMLLSRSRKHSEVASSGVVLSSVAVSCVCPQ